MSYEEQGAPAGGGEDEGYYDEWGEWVPVVRNRGIAPPEGHIVDAAGRLLGQAPPVEDPMAPDNYSTFVSGYVKPFMSARVCTGTGTGTGTAAGRPSRALLGSA